MNVPLVTHKQNLDSFIILLHSYKTQFFVYSGIFIRLLSRIVEMNEIKIILLYYFKLNNLNKELSFCHKL